MGIEVDLSSRSGKITPPCTVQTVLTVTTAENRCAHFGKVEVIFMKTKTPPEAFLQVAWIVCPAAGNEVRRHLYVREFCSRFHSRIFTSGFCLKTLPISIRATIFMI